MADYQITYWRELPSLVVAREGEVVSKMQLAPRFQHAIDEAAMRLGDVSSADYLDGWRRGDWTPGEGAPSDLATQVVERLEQLWTPEAIEAFLATLR
jgi:hypothetical protein